MVKEKWMIHAKKADFEKIASKYNISPYTARIIRNRDVIDDNDINLYLNGTIDSINSPFLYKDMDKAVDILLGAIKNEKSIRIIGDYDIDGICATYILSKGIGRIYNKVSIDIPDRIKDGYGINTNIIDRANNDGVELIITCDNGIAAIDEIAYAKSIGMDVIVTDHHEVPFDETEDGRRYKRVPADAVVDHKQQDCTYPFKDMCGAAVAYRYIIAVKNRLEASEDIKDIELAGKLSEIEKELVIFAAIATVGDVVSLRGENRVLVKTGLSYIADSGNIGLNALISACKLSKNTISAYHIGFVLGPCLNATGRLDTAKLAYELLCEEDVVEAQKKAMELVELNIVRKNLTIEGEEKAYLLADAYAEDKILVLYIEGIHESIAGVIAGRVREKFNKPAIVLTDGEEDVKGSGRSIESYDMFEELSKCKELLKHFGGHTMAAGLSLVKENIDELRRKLNDISTLSDEDMVRKKWIDIPLPISYISESFIEELKCIEPFGKDNDKPLFVVKDVTVRRAYVIGANKEVVKLYLEQDGVKMNGMIFRDKDDFFKKVRTVYGDSISEALMQGKEVDIKVSFLYYPTINEYNGTRSIQIYISGWLVKE